MSTPVIGPAGQVSKSRRDGLYLLCLGIAAFLLLGIAVQHSARDAHEDFKAVVYGSRCLLHHCDPYNEADLYRYYQSELTEPVATHLRSHTLTLYVNLPSTILLVAPLALLPFGLASVLWSILTAAALSLAALLLLEIASQYASTLSGALIALSLVSGAIVLGNGNPAGIVVGLAIIAVWCFLRERFVLGGILCLAVSLALKPHDGGLIWLYLLTAGPTLRKRALQTAAITAVISLVAVLWVSSLAPHWVPEIRSNLAIMSAPGGNNDPGPTGPTARDRATEMIISLQSVVSHFRNDPRFYNAVTWTVCGALLIAILAVTLRSRSRLRNLELRQSTTGLPLRTTDPDSRPTLHLSLLGLAAVTPITLLVTYHRAYDARLLMLSIPACAMLFAEHSRTGKWAFALTALALIFTGELPYALLKPLTGTLSEASAIFLDHAGPMAMLLLALFYTAVYLYRFLLGDDKFRRNLARDATRSLQNSHPPELSKG